MDKTIQAVWHMTLYLGLIIGVVAIYIWRFDVARQFWIVSILVGFYLIWGFSYHGARGNLTRKLIYEYLAISLISLLAAFIVFMS